MRGLSSERLLISLPSLEPAVAMVPSLPRLILLGVFSNLKKEPRSRTARQP
jgi:hypothetical protein